MTPQWIGPKFAGARDIARFGRVDALEPGLIFAHPTMSPSTGCGKSDFDRKPAFRKCHSAPRFCLLVKRCTFSFGPLGSISNCQTFWSFENLTRRRIAADGFKSINDPVPTAEKDEGPPIHLPIEGEDHVQWKICGAIRSSSRATSLPVRLSRTTKLGASGCRILRCVLSTPVPLFNRGNYH